MLPVVQGIAALMNNGAGMAPEVFYFGLLTGATLGGNLTPIGASANIAAIGILVAVLNQLLVRSGREEQAMMTTLAGLIVVLMIIIREIDALFQAVKSIFSL